VDAIVFRNGEQECCKWRASVVEDERRLAIQLVYLGLQIRVAGCGRDERGDPPGALKRLPKITNSSDAPALWTSARSAQFSWRKRSSGNQARPFFRMKLRSRSYFSSICSTDLLVCAVAVATAARAFFLFRRTMTECASPEGSLYSIVR
jgi:hypothetical protein